MSDGGFDDGRARDDDHPATLPWYVSGRLDPGARDAVRRHLEACAACRREVDALREMREAMRQPGGTDHILPGDLVAFEGGELAAAPVRAAAIAEHLQGCAGCAEEMRTLRESRRALESGTAESDAGVVGAPVALAEPYPPGAPSVLWKWTLFAAALLAVGVIVWPVRRSAPASAPPPLTQVETVTLTLPVRGGGEATRLSGTGPWVVTVLLPFGSAGGHYDLTIASAAGGAIAAPSRLHAPVEGTASFLLPSLPGEGLYLVRLVPAGATTGDPIEYRFEHRAK